MAQTINQRLRNIIGNQFGADVVEFTLEKALREAKEKASEPATQFYDPISMFMGREWLLKGPLGLGYGDLRAMARNPIIGSILQTRMNQVAAFCQPVAREYDLGFKVVHMDPDKKGNKKVITEIQQWLLECGVPGYGEPSLEQFARKFVHDSLVLDQACAEVVETKDGDAPAYVVAVDGGTIRRTKASLKYYEPSGKKDLHFVQVLHDAVVAEYTSDEMIFGVRNPRTDITLAGYGTSELEMLVRVVTTILNTEMYNSGQLAQGGTQKGVLVIKGDAPTDQVDSFKRDFRNAIRNAAKYWTPPVLRIGKDGSVDWLALDRSNRDMEYGQLFDFLVKQACAVYTIDPVEINWNIGMQGQRVNFEAGAGDKVTTSQERGLRPLLTFLSNQINSGIVRKIDDEYRMTFVGLDRNRGTDIENWGKEVTTLRTVNEIRTKDLNLPALPGGDIILNPIFQASADAIKTDETIAAGQAAMTAEPTAGEVQPGPYDNGLDFAPDPSMN